MNEEIYIQCMKDQISGGMYDHLFHGKSNLVFLDIGANIGLVSIYAVPFCKRIVAIEPNPDIFPQLVENTRNYSIIERQRVALAPVNEMVEFFINDINFTASSTVNTHGKWVQVEGMTLPRILAMNHLTHVDVCKCDAEGSEGESLSYHELHAARDIIDCFFIEMHNCPHSTWEYKMGKIVENLARCGYRNIATSGHEYMGITASRV